MELGDRAKIRSGGLFNGRDFICLVRHNPVAERALLEVTEVSQMTLQLSSLVDNDIVMKTHSVMSIAIVQLIKKLSTEDWPKPEEC